MKFNKKLKLLQIKDIIWEREFYPRSEHCPNWQTVYQYIQAMKSKSEFPPIIVGQEGNIYSIIDGVTRFEASKRLKRTEIYGYVIDLPKDKWYELSVNLNITNGQRFSPFEVSSIILKFRKLKYPDAKIAQIVRIPIVNIQKLLLGKVAKVQIGNNVTRNGKPIFEDRSIKNVIGHLAGAEVSEDIIQAQSSMYGWSQVDLIAELRSLLEKDLIDFSNIKIVENLRFIDKLIRQKIKIAA